MEIDQAPQTILQAPMPYFGGKRTIAPIVWERFGDVYNYCEPFFGSGAVLLNRPMSHHWPRIETVNDKDCFVANFYRALKHEPQAVAEWADQPVIECDLHARHLWLVDQTEFKKRMHSNPHYYDAKIAGWWVWGISAWIGSGWCVEDKKLSKQLPRLGGSQGVHRQSLSQQLPHLGPPVGIHRLSLSHKMPGLRHYGCGINALTVRQDIYDYFEALAARLRFVRVCCGDWMRILGPSPTWKQGLTAVFLDPPYSAEAIRDNTLYAQEDLAVSHNVREWAIENGNNPLLRIALCGYEQEHSEYMPADWFVARWKAQGGYANQANNNGQGRKNKLKEVIWFSPHCLRGNEQMSIF